MDRETAIEQLNNPQDRKPSELGEAVECLYQECGNYKAVAEEVRLPLSRLSQLHRIFLLPEGIRWQIDEGRIRFTHARQISRLEDEDDQWLLAFCIMTKRLRGKDTKETVDVAIQKDRPLRDVLQTLIGIRFEQVDEPLLLPFSFEDRFKISRAAWSKRMNWADFCLHAIEKLTRIDIEKIASELKRLASLIDSESDEADDTA
ncbi:MAG: hypothetical protein HQ591_03880 [candidate division Zixibacteria bacterium]|nr:hypothetical protein [Candidatus Tariuqbacter arcticus]